MEVYNDALEAGACEDVDIYSFMVENSIWTPQEEDFLNDEKNGILYRIEELKVKLYDSFFRVKDRKKYRKELEFAKEEYTRLSKIRHSFDYLTCHGVASFAKSLYIIENSTTTEGFEKYNWADITPFSLLNIYQSYYLTDAQYRELARTDPWSYTWSASKNSGSVFGKSGSELSDEQKKIIMWSSLYDNISESPDSPEQSVIEDDDMLDGWLIKQRRTREKDRAKNAGNELLSDKIAKSDEVYIVAQSTEDAEKIDRMNDLQASAIKKSRQRQIESKGTVEHQNFTDVKQKLSMQLTKMQTEKVKGNR